MKNKISLFLIYSFTITIVYSQKLPSIQLDRPDQTECPYIVPKNHLQLETGINYEKISKEIHSIVLPTILWKYGLNDKTEFRLITEMDMVKQGGVATSKGLNPIKIGFKTSICEEVGIIPKTSFIAHIALPKAASKDYKANFTAPLFRFTMQHTLSQKTTLSYNLGAEWDGNSAEATYIYTLTTGYSLSEKWGSYIELYGFLPEQNQARNLIDGGFTYLAQKNIMLDLSGGFGLTKNIQKWYVSFGFSFRLKD